MKQGDECLLSSTQQALHVLVVEDDEIVRSMCEATLAVRGFAVSLANNAAQAWPMINHHSYDVLITDHHMPGMSGLDLIRKLRQEKIALPCLLISGNMPRGAEELHGHLQPGGMLHKPFSPDQLYSGIRRLVGEKWDRLKTAARRESRPTTPS